jgi:hypothetical protein
MFPEDRVAFSAEGHRNDEENGPKAMSAVGLNVFLVASTAPDSSKASRRMSTPGLNHLVAVSHHG